MERRGRAHNKAWDMAKSVYLLHALCPGTTYSEILTTKRNHKLFKQIVSTFVVVIIMGRMEEKFI